MNKLIENEQNCHDIQFAELIERLLGKRQPASISELVIFGRALINELFHLLRLASPFVLFSVVPRDPYPRTPSGK